MLHFLNILSFTGWYFDYHCVFCLKPRSRVNRQHLLTVWCSFQRTNPSKVVKEIFACDFRGLVLSDRFFPDGLVINIDPTIEKDGCVFFWWFNLIYAMF